jgi:carbamoyltransferase
MKILGIAAPFGHDHSACILIDGKIVAAAEEERFSRYKHAIGQCPVNAVMYCLKAAGLEPKDIDCVAYPWSYKALRDKRWEYFFRTLISKPARAYKKLFKNKRELLGQRNFTGMILENCGFNPSKTDFRWVEHHLAHAASGFYFSGFKEAAVLSIDAGGEITSTLIGYADNKVIHKIKEVVAPDSLGDFYSTMTDYLGFDRGEGEYKVMGMAPYGDASRLNFSHIIKWDRRGKTYHCNDDYVWVNRHKRYRVDKIYSKKMVEEFGPERKGDGLAEPYIHIAAATQKALEDITVRLVETYLKDILKKHGNLCIAGGCALNVSMNRKILELPYVKNLWVQPASNDSGTALGAAAFVAAQMGDALKPMRHVYLGPEFSEKEIEGEIRSSGFKFSREQDICKKTAQLLAKGEIVGWFQGRMEWGPRALGNRSILGNPSIEGTADRINEMIKFREKWRPFCPSILEEFASDILDSKHPAEFMTIAFKVNPKWRGRIPEVVHVDGTCRPQVVSRQINPKFHKVIEDFYKLSGIPAVINTSLNRKGEPMVCSPSDALIMFKESGLAYLAIGDFLICKK